MCVSNFCGNTLQHTATQMNVSLAHSHIDDAAHQHYGNVMYSPINDLLSTRML